MEQEQMDEEGYIEESATGVAEARVAGTEPFTVGGVEGASAVVVATLGERLQNIETALLVLTEEAMRKAGRGVPAELALERLGTIREMLDGSNGS